MSYRAVNIVNMKPCCSCKKLKPDDDFYWKDRARGLRQAYCKECKKVYNAKWYAENAPKHKADVARNNQRYDEAARALLWELKSVPCADCGNSFPPSAMDFDNVANNKLMNVSRFATHRVGSQTRRLLEEVAKCEVVCAVCHRIRTFTRLGLTDELLSA
jgi:hypothetical protein